MPREPARNKKPRKEPTNFVARFRFSGQISNRATFFLPKCGFSGYSIPPNQLFRHFPTPTGGARCGTIPKNCRKMESCDIYGVQNVPKQTKPCDHGKGNAFQAPLFIHFDDPGLPIGNRDQESRKHHHFVYVSKEQLTFYIFCFQLPKHATRLLEFNMLKRLEYLHVVNAHIPAQGE